MAKINPEVSDLMAGLGSRIRSARFRQNLRLADVAERSGYSASFLSQVERGIANPSVGALKHIADALSIPAMEIFFSEDSAEAHAGGAALGGQARTSPAQPPVLIKRDRRRAMTYPQSSIRYELLVPHLRGALEVLWIEAPPGASTGEAYSHEAEECVLVIDGALEITIGDELHSLGEGDSVLFSGTTPHSWRNPGSTAATLVWVTTPPSF